MVSEVRDCMRMFPVPAKEPERMLVINEGDFLNIRPEDSAFEALQRLTNRASLKWGIMGLINIIGGNEQYTAAGFIFLGEDDGGRRGRHGDGGRDPGDRVGRSRARSWGACACWANGAAAAASAAWAEEEEEKEEENKKGGGRP